MPAARVLIDGPSGLVFDYSIPDQTKGQANRQGQIKQGDRQIDRGRALCDSEPKVMEAIHRLAALAGSGDFQEQAVS